MRCSTSTSSPSGGVAATRYRGSRPGGGSSSTPSSMAGWRPVKFQAVYSATKAGVDALSEALSEALRAEPRDRGATSKRCVLFLQTGALG